MDINPNLSLIQLRLTVFVQHNLLYLPEISNKFFKLFTYGAQINGILPNGDYNTTVALQKGMPWKFYWDETDFNIVLAFSYGKIDCVINCDQKYTTDKETELINKGLNVFQTLKNQFKINSYSRIAYCPMFGIQDNPEKTLISTVWHHLFAKDILDQGNTTEKAISWNSVRELDIISQKLQINYLVKGNDGVRTRQQENQPVVEEDVIILQYDINNLPKEGISLSLEDFIHFIEQGKEMKNKDLSLFFEK